MRVPSLALLVLFLVSSLVEAVEKPFNFAETPGKLPKEVVPTEYAVRIVPNLDNFAFAGSETVKLNVRSSVHQLVLNGLELKIEAAFVDGKKLPLSSIKTENEKELLSLTLPSEFAAGDHAAIDTGIHDAGFRILGDAGTAGLHVAPAIEAVPVRRGEFE